MQLEDSKKRVNKLEDTICYLVAPSGKVRYCSSALLNINSMQKPSKKNSWIRGIVSMVDFNNVQSRTMRACYVLASMSKKLRISWIFHSSSLTSGCAYQPMGTTCHLSKATGKTQTNRSKKYDHKGTRTYAIQGCHRIDANFIKHIYATSMWTQGKVRFGFLQHPLIHAPYQGGSNPGSTTPFRYSKFRSVS